MLEAVQVIHEEKIVHSDLKPANFVLVKGALKLIDFGIANAISNDTTNIQRDHQVSTDCCSSILRVRRLAFPSSPFPALLRVSKMSSRGGVDEKDGGR